MESQKVMSEKNVFISHGKYCPQEIMDGVKTVIRESELNPIVLEEQENAGQSILEKLCKYVDKSVYAVVIYSPDDVGRENKEGAALKKRARQNVGNEHTYLIRALGRKNICMLLTDTDIEIPSNLKGLVWVHTIDDWKDRLRKEIAGREIKISMNGNMRIIVELYNNILWSLRNFHGDEVPVNVDGEEAPASKAMGLLKKRVYMLNKKTVSNEVLNLDWGALAEANFKNLNIREANLQEDANKNDGNAIHKRDGMEYPGYNEEYQNRNMRYRNESVLFNEELEACVSHIDYLKKLRQSDKDEKDK
jgi:hypothetical protein